jgi:hypothetical protein
MPEHRVVMSRHLGRPLVKGETVHHKDGVRDHNDISNLELWFKGQPSGQRIEDLVEYVATYHREAVLAVLENRRLSVQTL